MDVESSMQTGRAVPDLESVPIELLESSPRRRPHRSRRRALILSGVAVFLAVGGMGLIARSGGSNNAQTSLTAIQAFLKTERSAHFDGTTENVQGGPGDLGETNTSRSRLDGDFVIPDGGHWVIDDGNSVVETLAVSGGSYVRAAPTRSGLAATRWNWTGPGGPTSLPPGPSSAVLLGSSVGVPPGAFGADTGEFRRLIDHLQSPTVVAPGVIRAKLSLTDLFGPFPANVGPFPGNGESQGDATVDLTIGEGGRLDRLVWRIRLDLAAPTVLPNSSGNAVPRSQSTTTTADVRFSAWNTPVSLDRPTMAQIDPTPGVDEEALGAFHAAPLVAPRHLPDGWVLQFAGVNEIPAPIGLPAGITAPIGLPAGITLPQSCPSVSLAYSSPMSFVPPPPPPVPTGSAPMITPWTSLSLMESAAACRDTEPGFPGGMLGTSEYHSVTVTVGATRIQASSNLPEAELRRLLGDLRPLDLAAQPIQRSVPPAG